MFRYLDSVKGVKVRRGSIPERKNIIHYEYPPSYQIPINDGNQTCPGLYVRCQPVLSNPVNSQLSINLLSQKRTYQWPWQAAIFTDGKYRCPALVLELNWLLASSDCSQNIKYVIFHEITKKIKFQPDH